jgi:NAD(P)H-nitrite reductase large subunit
MNLHINGFGSKHVLSELHLEFEWLEGLRTFRVKNLDYPEARKLKRILEERGLRVSMDNSVFGSEIEDLRSAT